MDAKFTLPEPEDESDRTLLSDIEKYGWHAVGVAEEANSPQFTFSVGLYYRHTHPEILIMGLKQSIAHSLICSIVDRVREGGKFEAGQLDTELASFPCTFVPVHPQHYSEYLGYGMWFYRSLPTQFPVLQLIWPDKGGLFPWQSGYDSRFYQLQRVLHGAS
jgi:hypothetical protein